MPTDCQLPQKISVLNTLEKTEIPKQHLEVNKMAAKELHLSPIEKAYVRDGDYADKGWRAIIRERGLDNNNTEVFCFKNGTPGFVRYVYFTFDISEIDESYKVVRFRPSFTQLDQQMSIYFNVYKLDPEAWDTETVTWNTKPDFGELLVENTMAGGLCSVDLTEAVFAAKANGETKLSIGLKVTTVGADGENRINPRTTLLVASESGETTIYVRMLRDDEAENNAVWDWAQKVYDEWYERYQMLLAKGENEELYIPEDPEEHVKISKCGGSGFAKKWTMDMMNKEYPTRRVCDLKGLGEYSDYYAEQKFDEFGGLIDESRRGEVTGFFYSKKVNGRWWIFDPNGYPCHIRAVSGVGINYLGSPNQKEAAINMYGDEQGWAEATTRLLQDKFRIYASTGSSPALRAVKNPLIKQLGSGGCVGAYGHHIGTNISNGGSTHFAGNNTMNVFDPGFIDFCDERQKPLAANKDDKYILGYTMDNELPMDANMLSNYLTIDHTDERFHYSYATAWNWLINMTGKTNPDQTDITPELNQLFRGFVWDRYYNVVTKAVKKYDPNHMLLGTRFLHGVVKAPWVLRFAALYLDCMTINWYGRWEIPPSELNDVVRNADIPLMITEFYTKAIDSGLANTRGAGWTVPTQQDRADFYQTYTLRLLECKNFIGWHWFQYIDNDPHPEVVFKEDGKTWRDQSSIDANKGIVDSYHKPYKELMDAMFEVNDNVYRLIDHFDAKYSK